MNQEGVDKMRKNRAWFSLAAGFASLLLTTTAVHGANSFAESALAPNPDKASGQSAPAPPRRVVAPPATEGTVTIFTSRALFQASFPGLPLENFEDGNAPGGGFLTCNSPLSSAGDPACGFNPGDILTGITFQDNPGPDGPDLILLGAGTSLNPSQALIANTFADAFDIVFDPPVIAAGMDLISTPAPGSGPPDIVGIMLFDANDVLFDTDPDAAASGPGNFWGFSSSTPIGRISILSINNQAEGVDNLEFSGQAALVASDQLFADSCASNPGNENGIFEPGEVVSIDVELTAVAGSFTNIAGTLTTSTPGVTILDGNTTWPNLTAGSSSFATSPLSIRLDEALACGSTVDLDLTVTATEGGPFVIALSELVGQPLEPNVPVMIPDADPTGVESELVVADDVVLTDVNVRVQISHTWVGDLLITLRAPDNTEVVLLDRPGVPMSGAGCLDDNLDVTFDDASGFDPESHCAGTNPWFVGTANPVGSLAVLNGMSSAGTWALFVSDNAGQDLGTIDDWELITTPAISGVCNVCLGGDADVQITKTASPTNVAPGGQLVYTLTVTNNGPDAASGVEVTDTLPAEVTYISDDCGGVNTPPFTWTIGNLAASSSVVCNITVMVNPNAVGPIVNTATVTSTSNDPVPGNASSAVTVALGGALDIPTLDTIGLALLFVALGGCALFLLRRRAQ